MSGCNWAVTGAAGFFGTALVDALLNQHGAKHVRALDVAALQMAASDRVSCHAIDLSSDAEARLLELLDGVDVVVHCAALIGNFTAGLHTQPQLWKVNVGGTEALLEAAKKCGVRAFVHISTVNVAFTGRDAIHWGSEDTPYPDVAAYLEDYGASKCTAELAVVAASKGGRVGRPSLATACLRVNGLWGAAGSNPINS